MSKKVLTLCIIHEHPRVLLGMKKRGFGQGRWNGFGGKVDENETIEEAAKRELSEEAGITVEDVEKMGVIDFEFQGNPEVLEVHIFRAQEFEGVPTESEEMKPQWFFIDEIPFAHMWKDDVFWFPYFLKGKKCTGRFLFDEKENIIEQELNEVTQI